MRHSNNTLIAIIAVLILALIGAPAFAQRGRGGGGRGGGGRGGRVGAGVRGGGGFRGGVARRAPAMRSSATRAPAARAQTTRAPAIAAQGRNNVVGSRGSQPGRAAIGATPGRGGMNARPPVTSSTRPGAVNTRSFGNTRNAGVNRGPGTAGVVGGNRARNLTNTNNLNRTNFVTSGNGSGRGYGYHRSYGGYGRYGRGFGGYGGYGGGGYGWPGYGYGGYGGYGLGGWGFPLGLLLGSSLGEMGYGGFGGYGGYGGYGGGGWGYPSYGYGGQGYGLGTGGLYSYGYLPYTNPYYSAGSASVAAYDYSQPIDVVSAAPPTSATEESQALFTAARASFKAGNVASALQQADDALTKTPGDTSLHEFRALCLFALGRYDEAAVPLYAVLAAGPGWDWATLAGLYANVAIYTSQVRALESYIQSHPQLSASRFVLAYHYLTQGHTEEAATQLRRVVALKPDDTLSSKILAQLQARPSSSNGSLDSQRPVEPSLAIAAPANAASTPMPEGATLAGTWTAHPTADSTIILTIQADGAFQWKVSMKGQERQFAGTSTFDKGLLTLVPENMPPLVGRLSWADATHMTFRAIGDSADSTGLSFSK